MTSCWYPQHLLRPVISEQLNEKALIIVFIEASPLIWWEPNCLRRVVAELLMWGERINAMHINFVLSVRLTCPRTLPVCLSAPPRAQSPSMSNAGWDCVRLSGTGDALLLVMVTLLAMRSPYHDRLLLY